MNRPLKATLSGAALLCAAGAQSSVLFDFHDGKVPVDVGAFDWNQTSFLAYGGNAAVTNRFLTDQYINSGGTDGANICGIDPSACQFTVYSHARLSAISDADGNPVANNITGLEDEITLVMSFVETVVGVGNTPGTTNAIASFEVDTSKPAFLEMYFDTDFNANPLSGFGFNDGTLILRATAIGASDGSFQVTNGTPTRMDVFSSAVASQDNYGNGTNIAGQSQLSVRGSGNQGNLAFGNMVTDSSFFLGTLADFGLTFQNISIALPFGSVNPSDCFTYAMNSSVTVGGTATGDANDCDNVHTDTLFSGQVHTAGRGILPTVGLVNGAGYDFSTNPDFLAQSDYNSAFDTVQVPEPGTLAVLGLGLGCLGIYGFRRREADTLAA